MSRDTLQWLRKRENENGFQKKKYLTGKKRKNKNQNTLWRGCPIVNVWRAIERIGNLNLMLSVESERENGNLVTHERL